MPSRRPRTLIFAFVAAIIFAAAALFAADLWWRHDRDLRAAEHRATNLSIALGEYVRGKFGAVDTASSRLRAGSKPLPASSTAWPSAS